MSAKNFVLNTLSSIGVFELLRTSGPRVLFYHGVADRLIDARIESESIQAYDFEKQLKYIVKHFHPIGLQEFYEKQRSGKWEKYDLLMTFDDGYKNMLSTGLTLLEKYNVPFALFLTTQNITTGELFPTTINRLVNLASSHSSALEDKEKTTLEISRRLKSAPLDEVNEICSELLGSISSAEWYELKKKYTSVIPLNWNEARIIASSPLCTVGSHCVTHICCHKHQNLDEVRRQFQTSRKVIQDKLGVPCEFLSYPNGSYTPDVMQIAKETGYKMAFSTHYEAIGHSDPMSVGRIYVPYDFARFKYAISRYPR